MKSGLFQLIKRAFFAPQGIHPVERGMARRWTKQRLAAVFPEPRNNPAALDRAYFSLGLEPMDGQEFGSTGAVFQLNVPGEI